MLITSGRRLKAAFFVEGTAFIVGRRSLVILLLQQRLTAACNRVIRYPLLLNVSLAYPFFT